jgi:predicted RNA binding protein YcfA (HicA-like mRNA interferase family)
MKLPRDISGESLILALRKLEYQVTRQKGSHIRLTTLRDGEHHATIPNHSPLKISTLNSILKDIAHHHRLSVEELIRLLDF